MKRKTNLRANINVASSISKHSVELEQALRLAADERDKYGRLVLDLIEHRADVSARRAAIESSWDAYERGNALLAAFLGAKVGRMKGIYFHSDVIDHPAAMYVGRKLLGCVTHTYNAGDLIEVESNEFLARALALPSWWNKSARVFIIMSPDALQWGRLQPLLTRQVSHG